MQKKELEAFVIGIMTLIVGSLVGYVTGKIAGINLPSICKKWNKNHIMEISLFLTGVIIHLVCEFGGLNKWYCSNGNACK